MKAAEIRKCGGCGRHPLHQEEGRYLTFHEVTIQRAVIDPRAVRQIHGIDTYFGGGHGLLAEMFAPDPHVVKTPEELQVKLHVCEPCATDMTIWELLEAHNETRERQEAES
jgi:hypothetical protein